MRTYLEPADIEMLERAASCPRDRILIRLLFRLGCRVSEVLSLRVGDIDFAEGTVMILHLKKRLKLACPSCKTSLGRRHRFCPGCGAHVPEAIQRQQEYRRVRVLPIDKATLALLQKYISGEQFIGSGSEFIFSFNRHRG